MPEQTDIEAPSPERLKKSAPFGFAVLVFCFGLAVGVLAAVTGHGVLQDSARLIFAVFLVAVLIFALVAAGVFLARKQLLLRLFGVAQAQMEMFADPLSEVAQGAAERDAERATQAARSLIQLTLARFAILSTRRWIIASLTGLIAAMAALAGTALLFKQNELLAVQTELLTDQNSRIEEQSALLRQQVELAEAARNAEIAIEITNIAGLLGVVMDEVQAVSAADRKSGADMVSVIDPLHDMKQSLVMRIIAASRAAKPYRSLAVPYKAHDAVDKLRVATGRRRADLPKFYERSKALFGFDEPSAALTLTERPSSPERAQLLRVLARSGVVEMELLNFFGMDLSFAAAEDIRLFARSMQNSQLSFADFSRADIVGTDLRASSLENAQFYKARLKDVDLSNLQEADAKGGFDVLEGGTPTFLSGASFENGQIENVTFAGSQLTAASFDASVITGADFTGALLQAATFRGSFIASATFKGAALHSVDLDGAWVLQGDFLERLAEQAMANSFVPSRFEMREADEAARIDFSNQFTIVDVPDAPLYRITRVAPFEQSAPE